jgi:exodeoxyribonuclease VIII
MNIIIDQNYTPKWMPDLNSEEYHSDLTAVNSSALKDALKSPASFKTAFTTKKDPTPAMEFGTLVHTAILEFKRFKSEYIIKPDFGNMRLKENKAAAEEWLNANSDKKFVAQDDYNKLIGIAESISNHKDAISLLTNGQIEQSGYFTDPETCILNRIRPDFLSNDKCVLVDLKTTTDCTLNDFSRTIWNFRYDFQMAMYSEGVRIISGKRPDFHVFIVVEKTPPYECAVYVADDALLEKGMQDYKKALKVVFNSLQSGIFNKYQSEMENISLPAWAF